MKEEEFDKKRHKCETSRYSFIFSVYTVFSNGFALEHIRQETIKQGRKLKVLEVGCYVGNFITHSLQMRVFFDKYVGFDINPEYISEAKKLYGDRNDSEFILGNFSDPNSEVKEQFDVIVCLEMLEHITENERENVYKNFSRFLKSGGLLLIGCPINTKTQTFHVAEREKAYGHISIPVYEDVIEKLGKENINLEEFYPSYSLKSRYRIKDKSEWYLGLRKHLGAAARYIRCSVPGEQTGGGHFVFRKRKDT